VDAKFFAQFGLYVKPGAVDAADCRRLAAEAREANATPATIRDHGEQLVDENYRRTRIAEVSSESVQLVADLLDSLKPSLDAHFGVAAASFRRPEFLVYRAGDFFAPHADSVTSGNEEDAVVTGRVISAVLFLNGESETSEDGGYQGGTLDFYGLLDDERLKDRAFPLTGEEGLLVAFRPDVVHGVSPVTSGERCTVVTWFEG